MSAPTRQFAQGHDRAAGAEVARHQRARRALPRAGHPADFAARRPRVRRRRRRRRHRRRRQSLPRLQRRHRRGVDRPRPSGARRGAARAGAQGHLGQLRLGGARLACSSASPRRPRASARASSRARCSTRAAPKRSSRRCAWPARTPRSTRRSPSGAAFTARPPARSRSWARTSSTASARCRRAIICRRGAISRRSSAPSSCRRRGELAAIIAEPMQGTAGNILPPPGFLAGVRDAGPRSTARSSSPTR